MKSCPYCYQPVEDNWSYCHHCNKPLIVNIDSETEKRISHIYDDDIGNIYDYQVEDDLYENNVIKDEKIEERIEEINEILDEPQILGKTTGKFYLEKASLYYKNRDLATSLKFLEMALKNFKEENDILNLAITHNEIGLLNEENGFYDNAIYQFQQSIENLQKLNESSKLILIYNNLANIYYLIKDLEHSYEYYSKALDLAKQENLLSEEIKTSSNIVDILFLLKNYDKIKRILTRNLDYFKQTGEIYGVIITLIKIGKLNYHLGSDNYEYSHEKLIEALELINSAELQKKLIHHNKAQLEWECSLYLGKLSLLQNNNKEAEDYLLKSLNSIRSYELGVNLNEAKVLKNLAKTYEEMGENQRAIDYYTMASEVYYKFGDDIKVASLKNEIASVYLNKLKNDSEAINNYEDALEIFEDQSYMKESADILQKLGDIYINKSIIELALSHWEKARDIYREILDEVNLNLVMEKINTLNNSN